MSRINRPRRTGITAVYTIVILLVLCGFVSFAVDWGKVQLCKTELQQAADAAARAAVLQLPSGVTATRDAAVLWAGDNTAAQTSVVIDRVNDVDFGTWDTSTRTFTVLTGAARSNANSVRVWARRTTANGNALPLTFGALIGQSTCNVNTYCIATLNSSQATITGLSSITIHDNLFIGSYNSAVTTNPTTGTAGSAAVVQTNGTISGGTSGDSLHGNVNLGPSGSVSTITVSGSVNNRTQNLVAPTMPAMTSVTNPGGVSATPNVSGSVSWPGGVYYFTSFTMSNSATLTFTGPATVYMNGTATINDDDTLTPYGSRPGNLVWYQASGTTFTGHDRDVIGGDFIGPAATFTLHDNGTIAGSLVFQSLTIHDNDSVFMDTSATNNTGSVALVK